VGEIQSSALTEQASTLTEQAQNEAQSYIQSEEQAFNQTMQFADRASHGETINESLTKDMSISDQESFSYLSNFQQKYGQSLSRDQNTNMSNMGKVYAGAKVGGGLISAVGKAVGFGINAGVEGSLEAKDSVSNNAQFIKAKDILESNEFRQNMDRAQRWITSHGEQMQDSRLTALSKKNDL